MERGDDALGVQFIAVSVPCAITGQECSLSAVSHWRTWTVVQQTIGYRRYESPAALALLKVICADLWLYIIFFQPVLKLVSTRHNGSKVHERYDTAKTPYP